MMKLKLFVIAITIFSGFSFSVLAQEEIQSDVVYLTPDEYTDVLVGDRVLPNHVKFFRLDSSRNNVVENVTPVQESIPFENSTEIEDNTSALSEIERDNFALMLYFNFIEGQVQSLGQENVARILASTYVLDLVLSEDLVHFVLETNDLYSKTLIDRRIENCNSFNDSIENSNQLSVAVHNMQHAELDLKELPHEFYPQVRVDLSSLVGQDVLHSFNSQLDAFKDSMQSGHMLFQNDEENLFSHYVSLCDYFLSQK